MRKNPSGEGKHSFFSIRTLLWLPAVAFVGLFFYLPLAAVLRLGVEAAGSGDWGSFTIHAALDVAGQLVGRLAHARLQITRLERRVHALDAPGAGSSRRRARELTSTVRRSLHRAAGRIRR